MYCKDCGELMKKRISSPIRISLDSDSIERTYYDCFTCKEIKLIIDGKQVD